MKAKTKIPETEDLGEFEKIRLGYDVQIAREFRDKLRSLCAEYDLNMALAPYCRKAMGWSRIRS